MLEDIDITEFIMESINNREPTSATKEEFEKMLAQREETLKEWYDNSLIGFSTFDDESKKRIKEIVDTSENIFGGPQALKIFVKKSLNYIGGEMVSKGAGLFKISIPQSNLEQLIEKFNLKDYITFNRDRALEREDVKYLSPDSSVVQFLIKK